MRRLRRSIVARRWLSCICRRAARHGRGRQDDAGRLAGRVPGADDRVPARTARSTSRARSAMRAACLDAGCSGLIMLGTLGENSSLAPDEKEAVLRAAVEAADGRVPVIAGVAEYTTELAHRPGAPRRAGGLRRADGAALHGLRAGRARGGAPFPHAGGRHRPADHDLQQPAGLQGRPQARGLPGPGRIAPTSSRSRNRRTTAGA